jgi:putative spermidine/putrescine transport system permease protein
VTIGFELKSMASAEFAPSARRRRLQTIVSGYALILPALLLVAFIIVYPALLSVIETLTTRLDGGSAAFTLEQYAAFFTDPLSVMNLLYTLRVTLTVVVLLYLISFPISLYLRFSHSRLTNLIHILALFPLFVPGIVLAFAMIRFTITHGLLDTLLSKIGITAYVTPYLTTTGSIIGLVWEGIPFTVLILSAAMVQVDDSLLESARDVGANPWQIFWRILLPLIKNAVVIIFSLEFLGILGSYTVPYLLGPAEPEMMSVFMERTYHQVHAPLQAQTQAVITFLIAAIAGYVYVRTVASQQKSED